MSVEIKIANKTVLRTSSGVFESLYLKIRDIIKDNKIFLPQEIISFMEIMEIYSINCSYFHIDDFITKASSLNLFIKIFEQAIKELTLELPDFTIKSLWNFYQELSIYYDKLVKQAK